MTETFNQTSRTETTDHTRFGGIIHPSDFNTGYIKDNNYGSSIANRIISDWHFDRQCMKNIKIREENRRYK